MASCRLLVLHSTSIMHVCPSTGSMGDWAGATALAAERVESLGSCQGFLLALYVVLHCDMCIPHLIFF